jgi:phage repressor protein C with HTH and peptisase S24 domain
MDNVNPEITHLSEIGKRLRVERELLRLSQSELGAFGGVQKNAQHNYEIGKRAPDASYLAAVAKIGVNVRYVLTGDRRDEYDGASDAADLSAFASIPVYAATLAAGAGGRTDDEALMAHLAFRRDWLRGIGVAPGAAVIARAAGDSMEPTIQSGDLVLIDRARADPPARARDPGDTRPARIYALRDEAGARLKRIERATPATLALLSDNPATPHEFRPAADVAIIGRVVWWAHTDRE